MTGNVLLSLLSQSLALFYAAGDLLCCDAECVVEDEVVVFIPLVMVMKAIFDDRW